MESSSDLDVIGLKLRALSSGMHRSGSNNRRRLISEGRALLTYVLKKAPTSVLLRRYVRMVEKLRKGVPLKLPRWSLQWPVSLTLLDSNASLNFPQGVELLWRIDAAVVIAEASKQGAIRMASSPQSTWLLMVLIRMTMAIVLENLWRFLRLVLPSSILRFS